MALVSASILALAVAAGIFLLSRTDGAVDQPLPGDMPPVVVGDPYGQWGVEQGDLPATPAPVITPENAPLQYAPLDAAFLSSLSEPAEGRLTGSVVSVESRTQAVVRAQALEVIDSTGEQPLLRLLPADTRVTVTFAEGLSPAQPRPLAEGDFIVASVRLEPGPGRGTGRFVVQSYDRAP